MPEIEQAFDKVVQQKASMLLVNPDAFFTAERDLIVRLAARNRVPTIYAWREFADAGGLMSYGINLRQGYHQVGTYVGRILNGEKPADLPVMQRFLSGTGRSGHRPRRYYGRRARCFA